MTCKKLVEAMVAKGEEADKKLAAEYVRVGAMEAAVAQAMVKIRAMRESHSKAIEEKERTLAVAIASVEAAKIELASKEGECTNLKEDLRVSCKS